MKQFFRYLIVSAALFSLCLPLMEAKKIRNSFKIENKKSLDSSHSSKKNPEGVETNLPECSFSGYDKEVSSNIESFILTNPTDKFITGFNVVIEYLDMQGRMFHSREITESCHVPPGESRRIDIPGWDKQHTYYYYLGNEPRRVATPFKVVFHPKSFWIKD